MTVGTMTIPQKRERAGNREKSRTGAHCVFSLGKPQQPIAGNAAALFVCVRMLLFLSFSLCFGPTAEREKPRAPRLHLCTNASRCLRETVCPQIGPCCDKWPDLNASGECNRCALPPDCRAEGIATMEERVSCESRRPQWPRRQLRIRSLQEVTFPKSCPRGAPNAAAGGWRLCGAKASAGTVPLRYVRMCLRRPSSSSCWFHRPWLTARSLACPPCTGCMRRWHRSSPTASSPSCRTLASAPSRSSRSS